MRDKPTPYLSYIGLILWLITVLAHLTYHFVHSSDVGLGIILSVADAMLLIYTLLWSIMGIIELSKLRKLRMRINYHLTKQRITEDIHRTYSRRLSFCLTINGIYLFLVFCQLIYVIYQWEELMV